nr:sulfatase-like hydrolase/transferase [Allomuricauda sp.]
MKLTFKYKKFLGILVLAVFLGCGPKTEQDKSAADQNPTTPPNIILIMTDDQGWGDTGYNGHPFLKTPNLDDMAANGVVFNRFYAASAVCSPTRGSVMTGRHPLRYGICTANCGHIKTEEITLAEMVKEKGYTTGHFGKWHLGTLTRDTLDANRGGKPENYAHYAPPSDHGFDTYFVTESKVPTWDPMITPPRSAGGVSPKLTVGEPFQTFYWSGPGMIETENLEGDDSRVIMDRVIPFVEEAAQQEQPFLSVVWFHSPHLPVLTGDSYRKPYHELSEDQQQYYGTLTAMDEQIGRLRNKLKELGISDNTILFFTSDNGPEGKAALGRTQGGTKGLKGRKRSLYEGGIRVPGIMEWSGNVPQGKTLETPCFTSDYFPTIANLLGIDTAKYNRPFDGMDLMPLIEGEQEKRNKNLAFRFNNQAALIGHTYKIYSRDDGNSFELYNLNEDPSESVDLAESQPGQLKEMIQEWQTWKNSQEMSAQGMDYQQADQ